MLKYSLKFDKQTASAVNMSCFQLFLLASPSGAPGSTVVMLFLSASTAHLIHLNTSLFKVPLLSF